MDAESNPPTWASGQQEGVREHLPPWLGSQGDTWETYLRAMVPSPPRWRSIHPGDIGWRPILGDLETAILSRFDVTPYNYGRPDLSGYSQQDLENLLRSMLEVETPEGYRAVLCLASDSDSHTLALFALNASVSVSLQKWDTNTTRNPHLTRITPLQPSADLVYWVAFIQAAEGSQLVLLTTPRKDSVNLAFVGPMQIWAYGMVTTVVLPVAAARLDSSWEGLPYVLAYCTRHELVYQAFHGYSEGSPPARSDFD